jgi:hypothetical protein
LLANDSFEVFMSGEGSIGAWCVHKDGMQGCTAELHFNYWRLGGDPYFTGKDGNLRDFVEIGVWLTQPSKIEKVRLFLPTALEARAVMDCGHYFAVVEIAQGIFNEPLTCNVQSRPHSVNLMRGHVTYCRVHNFLDDNGTPDSSQLEIFEINEGAILTITRRALDEVCSGLTADTPAYFRLRAYVTREMAPFVHILRPRDRFFQSGFNVIEYLDFRLNEARTLPLRVESEMRADAGQKPPVPFTRIAFLTALPVSSDLILTSKQSHKNRLLEHDFWNQYVPSGIPDGMMVYHWRADDGDGIEDFSAFIKMQTRRTSNRIVIIYVGTAFLFGVLGNLSASMIEKGLGKIWSIAQKCVQ